MVKDMSFKSGVKGRGSRGRGSDRWWEWRWWLWWGDYAQDEVNQVKCMESEQNEVDKMKKELIPQVRWCIMWKSGWWYVMRNIQVVELRWQETRSELYL